MRYLVLLLLLLYACTSSFQEPTGDVVDEEPMVNPLPEDPLVGEDPQLQCTEGQELIDGECRLVTNNSRMFNEDFTGKVVTQELADGFLAKPAAEGNYPGVVMIHEWWGLNDNIRDMAQILANEGYVVYAVDLYGESTSDPARAQELATAARNNPQPAIDKMKSAVAYLKNAEGVDKVTSLGWCFGGQMSLLLSLNEDVDATVIYYGQLIEDKEQLAKLQGPVLGIFGEEDESIPVQSVRAFAAALDSFGIDNEIIIYPGVGHAFANPSGANYAEQETRDAWAKTLQFLEQIKPADQAMQPSQPVADDMADIKVISLTAMNFNYNQDNARNPTIIINQGERVRIELTSKEGMHDLVIDGIGKTERVNAGQTSSFEFTANGPGEHEYYCSVGNHRELGMRGRLLIQ
jgi:carboxymethylenebutenolidase